MGNIFSGSEIVGLGIQIEKNGRDFYNAVALRASLPRAAEVFKYLAREEERHILVFEKILEKKEQLEPPESYAGEYLAYMQALAAEHIFTRKNKGEEAAKKINNDREAVEIGIKVEQESIVFYEGMKKAVPDYDHQVIDELIVQEQVHLARLYEIKKDF
jgi:rubrerythrin